MIFRAVLYFLRHGIFSPRRGKLLLLAVTGLVFSSFALLVVQGAMGGLQRNLMDRSQRILGGGLYRFHDSVPMEVGERLVALAQGFLAYPSYELEVLLKRGETLWPSLLHGIGERRPPFLGDHPMDDMVMPFGLSMNLGAKKGEEVLVITPSHTDSFMEDIPRSVTARVSAIFSTLVPEIDEYAFWVRLPLVHNLVRKRHINTIRFYGPREGNWQGLKEAFSQYRELGSFQLWEEAHRALVWALNLEKIVMVFLFSAMTLLVSLCITSGFMIFLDKIKHDMVALWILGVGDKALGTSSRLFLFLVSVFSCVVGVGLGLMFLFLFDRHGPEILPHVFVDRKIPISISREALLTSFFIPLGISLFFGHLSLSRFRKGESHLHRLRSVGH